MRIAVVVADRTRQPNAPPNYVWNRKADVQGRLSASLPDEVCIDAFHDGFQEGRLRSEIAHADIVLQHCGKSNDKDWLPTVTAYRHCNPTGFVILFSGASAPTGIDRVCADDSMVCCASVDEDKMIRSVVNWAMSNYQIPRTEWDTERLKALVTGRNDLLDGILQLLGGIVIIDLWQVANGSNDRRGLEQAALEFLDTCDENPTDMFENHVAICVARMIVEPTAGHDANLRGRVETAGIDTFLRTPDRVANSAAPDGSDVPSMLRHLTGARDRTEWTSRLLLLRDALLSS